MNTYKIISFNKGFFKVTRPDGIIHNMSEKMVKDLKLDKSNKFVEVQVVEIPTVITPKDSDIVVKPTELTQAEELIKLKKDDLAEMAKRYGFSDEVTNEITKAILVEFIISKSE